MRTLDPTVLALVTGGAPNTGMRYAKACVDGAVSTLWMTGGIATPQTLAIGCGAGMAGEALGDAIQYARSRR